MPFIRSISRWTLTALVINSIIGAGIFGMPSELSRLLGRASPLAMIVAALLMANMLVCMAEVASQFSEPGGPYLYVRTAFGRLAGIEVAWFHLLAGIGGGAASATLFISYLAGMLPSVGHGTYRALVLLVLIMIPTLANYYGVRSGSRFAAVLTVMKLVPLALVIGLGLWRFGHNFEILRMSEIRSPSFASWLAALLGLVFSYGGSEDALVPAGEMRDPRRTVPFALLSGLLACSFTYTLVQFVIVATIGTKATDRPLADAASVLIGPNGGFLVALAVMVSTYGWLSGAVLNLPRIVASLSIQGDLPRFIGKLHPKFNTPAVAILLVSSVTWFLAVAGSFLWVAVISGAATAIIYAGTCAALIRLRRQGTSRDVLRIPFGNVLAGLGILVALGLLTQLDIRQVWIVALTAFIPIVNWHWAKRYGSARPRSKAAVSGSE
jgi:amino acid transporter